MFTLSIARPTAAAAAAAAPPGWCRRPRLPTASSRSRSSSTRSLRSPTPTRKVGWLGAVIDVIRLFDGTTYLHHSV